MRVFAGPNGSGKSTIFNRIKERGFDVGFYINADEIEIELHKGKLYLKENFI